VRRAVRHESCLALGPSRAPHSARLSPSAAEWVTVGPVTVTSVGRRPSVWCRTWVADR
jgi:hypothetical protein